MLVIPLIQTPNQLLSFNADGAIWSIQVYQTISFMCADISLNNVPLINGVRCFGGIPLMPYTYMYQPDYGNFVFDTDADWNNFGASCNLFYLDSAELVQFLALRAQVK
jgi:hypothetical protein